MASVAILAMFSVAAGQEVTVSSQKIKYPDAPGATTLYGAHMDLTWFWDPTYKNQRIEAAANIGVQVGRNSLLWALIESQPGQFDWTVPDAVVKQMASTGIEPLFTVQGSPAWANGTIPAADSEYYLQVPQETKRFDRWVTLYSEFVSRAVRRYKGVVHKWELGNEENWEGYWRPRPNLDQYASWYQHLSTVILREDPTAQIAVGGLTLLLLSNKDIGPNISGLDFVRGLWDRGIYPKAIAIHPYSDHDPSQFIPGKPNFLDLVSIRQLLLDNGQLSTKLWITEFGWLDNTPSNSQRAVYLTRALGLVRECFSPFVSIAIYFPLFDNPPYTRGGLLTEQHRISQAGSSFQAFVNPTTALDSHTINSCPAKWNSE